MRGLSLDGDLRDEQEEYAENVHVYDLINSATALANSSRKDVGGSHTSVQDISVGFGVDRLHLNVVCKEAPGVGTHPKRMRATLIRCWTGITVLKRSHTTSGFTIATSKTATDSAEIVLASWLHS